MRDELWMQTWNDGHPRFSDDLHRGILWMLTPLRRLGNAAAPHITGEDSIFARPAPRLSGQPHRKPG